MKNIFSIIACLTIFMSSTTITWAQTPTKQRTQRDTTVSIEHVTINATRASARTPLTYSNLDRQAINRLNTG
ncbi:MAG: hypothetical protein RR465_03750, partial [Mucinivorans sp.]